MCCVCSRTNDVFVENIEGIDVFVRTDTLFEEKIDLGVFWEEVFRDLEFVFGCGFHNRVKLFKRNAKLPIKTRLPRLNEMYFSVLFAMQFKGLSVLTSAIACIK